MDDGVKGVLISEKDVKKKVKELGEMITKDYTGEKRKLVVIGLLRGSFVFMADLIREINMDIEVDFMTVSSYGNMKTSSREIKIVQDLDTCIMGKEILIVEDIIDSGLTLKRVVEVLKIRKPKSVKICTFLNKPSRREADIKVDYSGYDIPDEFVVGYGLDFAQRYRNLPYIGILEGEE